MDLNNFTEKKDTKIDNCIEINKKISTCEITNEFSEKSQKSVEEYKKCVKDLIENVN